MEGKLPEPDQDVFFISAIFFFMLMTFFREDAEIITGNSSVKNNQTSSVKFTKQQAKKHEHKNVSFAIGNDTVSASLRQYDSVQRVLSPDKRDNFITDYYTRRAYATLDYINTHTDTYLSKINEQVAHSFPQMFFIALPVFALFLKLLYFRQNRYNYVSHAIFSIHYYCVAFIALFLLIIANNLDIEGYYIAIIILLPLLVYLFIAMKRFYK